MTSGLDVSVDRGALILTIDRPERANALTPELAVEMADALEGLSSDGSLRLAVIRGAGDRAFCAGYDLKRAKEGGVADTGLDRLMAALRATPVPIVAAGNGHAIGAGFELFCRADLRIAKRGALVGLPAVRLGVAYRLDGLAAVATALGPRVDLLLTGAKLPVEEVPGLAHLVDDGGELDAALEAVSTALAEADGEAVAYTLDALRALRATVSDDVRAPFEERRRRIMAANTRLRASGPDR